MKWEKEVERVMKKRNLTSGEAVNRKLWRLTPVTGRRLENRKMDR